MRQPSLLSAWIRIIQLLLVLDLRYNDLIVHAALGQLFDPPVVLTSSAQQVPNGPLPKEIPEMTLTHPSSSTAFLALSLRVEGYSVWANVEASGTTTELLRDVSKIRMKAAGVNLELLPWLNQYYPIYGMVARGHAAAINNGIIAHGKGGVV
ncbi:hypothetical protein V1517DRAFT_353317 [Lipomyces orientalis]|uniref:Uncharacterized protein n=1 Tax=Lipomyces orientalis TaxID=1233043 RepID=A0ACC3TLM9_9ASCO